jgi:hypothetical protein
MAIDDLFQSGTDKVLDDRVARPLAEPPPQRSFGFNAFSTVAAVPKGGAAGLTESGGFFADILGAYGEAQAGQMRALDPALMFDQKEAERVRAEGAGARERIRTGEAFSTEIGTSLRQTARDYAPDPASANQAESLLFGLSRFVTKAVGYSLAAGPVPGAVLTGADEGMTEADRLKDQGVDMATRTKVGVVAGAVAGASVALPVVGKTWRETIGLAAVGGPGGFIAQQAASKAILANADYDQLAEQYDPFDPVGLAVSSLVPLGFGAYAMRGARARANADTGPAVRQLEQMAGNEKTALKYDDARLDAYAVTAAQREGIPPEMLLAIKNAGERSNSGQVSTAGAKGVMQFMDSTWSQYGRGDPRDPTASIDAGARYMKDLLKQYDGNQQAALAHYNGGTKAGDAVMRGERPPAKETRDYLERTERFIAERAGTEQGKAAAADPEIVAAARVQQVRETVESLNPRDPADVAGQQAHFDSVMRAADQLAAGERVNVAEVAPLDVAAQVRLIDTIAERIETAREDMPPDFVPESVGPMRAELETIAQVRQAADEVATRAAPDEHAVVKFADEGKADAYLREKKISRTHMVENTGRDEYSVRPKKQAGSNWREKAAAREAKLADQLRVAEENIAARTAAKAEPAPAPAAPAPEAPVNAPDAPTAGAAPKADANPLAASIDAQTAELARLAPDMMVQLEGMDAPMRLADALEAVKAEAAKDAETAPLYQVAAECLLQNT